MADDSSATGQWTYRSYLDSTDLVTDADSALAMIFGQGIFTFQTPSSTTLKGTFDMGGGLVLDLEGTIQQAGKDSPLTLQINGYGRPGTGTDGWEYDYYGFLAHSWPNGVNQVPVLVGTVIRAKPHNGGAAGVTASFIAVKRS
jgi:hypothetical protein